MTHPTLFEMPETTEPIRWNEMVTSVSDDETKIIRWIINLHNHGQPFDVDPTYSTGHFWEGLPQPRQRFDLAPQSADVVEADARNLPLADASVDSIMFDPPFVVDPNRSPGIIRDRFSCYPNVPALWAFYRDAMSEFYRISRPKGLLVFKCQDMVSSGKQHWSHVAIMNMAEVIGFRTDDLFVYVRTNLLWSPNMANQRHARKSHSYFLVLKKDAKLRKLAARIA